MWDGHVGGWVCDAGHVGRSADGHVGGIGWMCLCLCPWWCVCLCVWCVCPVVVSLEWKEWKKWCRHDEPPPVRRRGENVRRTWTVLRAYFSSSLKNVDPVILPRPFSRTGWRINLTNVRRSKGAIPARSGHSPTRITPLCFPFPVTTAPWPP